VEEVIIESLGAASRRIRVEQEYTPKKTGAAAPLAPRPSGSPGTRYRLSPGAGRGAGCCRRSRSRDRVGGSSCSAGTSARRSA